MTDAKKRLGQHWLHDQSSLSAIVDAADLNNTDTVLEIGPGLGDLTEHLAGKADKVVAVELDDDLIARLEQRFAGTKVDVKHASILNFDLTTLPRNYKVVANIPYYLTAKIVRQLLTSTNPPSVTVLLVQKEVAERITAKPGDMSLLAVSVQFYGQAEALDLVPRAAFTPPPKVDSQVVRITRYDQPALDVDEVKFFRLVKAGFSERRKKLRSSLSGGLKLDKPTVDDILAKTGLDLNARAQDLDLADWDKLYNSMYNYL